MMNHAMYYCVNNMFVIITSKQEYDVTIALLNSGSDVVSFTLDTLLYRSGSAILELKLFHCFFCSGNGSTAHCCEAIKLPASILLYPLLRCCRRGPS